MPANRLPALVALLVMLFVAPVPWRVTAHAAEHHGRVWLPDASALAHVLHDHDGHRHAHDAPPARHTCSCSHEQEAPEAPAEPGCHCTDEPLATGVLFAVVACDAPLAGAPAHLVWLDLVSRGAPEVAPSDPGGCRRACQEDPIVLLR